MLQAVASTGAQVDSRALNDAMKADFEAVQTAVNLGDAVVAEKGVLVLFFFFQAEDGIRDLTVTGVQTCALPIYPTRATQAEVDALEADIAPFIESLTKDEFFARFVERNMLGYKVSTVEDILDRKSVV